MEYGQGRARFTSSFRKAIAGSLCMLAMVTAAGAAVLQSKSYEYDARGRVTKEKNAAGSVLVTYTYDGNGNLKTVTDALGRVTTHDYDELDRLIKVTVMANNAVQSVTEYGYDARDNLTSVKDPRNLVTSYTYSGFDHQIAQSSPDTGSTSFVPNKAGQVTARTNAASQATQYQYDAVGRVTQTTYADSSTVSYSYDAGLYGKGRLTGLRDSEAALAWDFNADGQVTSRTQTLGTAPNTVTQTLGYGYNGAGQLASLTYPSGAVIGFTYDTQGRVASLTRNGTNILSSIQYRPFGGITQWTWGNGQAHTRIYDQNGRLDFIAVGPTVHDLNYDAVSRIDEILDMGNNSLSRDFSYDSLGRLIGYTGQNSTRVWAYDAVGNRTSQEIVGASTTTYSHATNSNRLLGRTVSGNSAQDRSYQYTATGHIEGDGVNTFGYDARERMTSATTPVATASYTINPLGQRVQKSVTQGSVTATTQFVYDDAGRLVAETDGAGGGSEYVYLGDIPVAMARTVVQGGVPSTMLYYVQADHLNTPRLLTTADANGTVVWRWDSEPFGSTLANADPDQDGQPIAFNLRFPGQYFDAETQLHYNYFRDYDPSLGRYVQSDPVGLGGGINTYAYVSNNPLGFVDPNGLWQIGDSLPQQWVDAVAGFGDTLSMGASGAARDMLGVDGGVDTCSAAYGYGEWGGVGLSVAFGGAHLGRNALNQMGRRGGLIDRLRRGIGRVGSDPRSWGRVRNSWSRAAGGGRPWLAANGQSLHHWFLPQRFAPVNAGWNYMPLSAGFNTWMNGSTPARVAAEWLFRAQVTGIYAAPVTAAVNGDD
jgi:RHS repeat-associated protein